MEETFRVKDATYSMSILCGIRKIRPREDRFTTGRVTEYIGIVQANLAQAFPRLAVWMTEEEAVPVLAYFNHRLFVSRSRHDPRWIAKKALTAWRERIEAVRPDENGNVAVPKDTLLHLFSYVDMLEELILPPSMLKELTDGRYNG